MAFLTIRLGEFSKAEGDCLDVRDKANDYSEALKTKVLKKINSYSGKWTSNMSTAQSNIEKKRSNLSSKASSFSKLSDDIGDLGAEIGSAELALKQRIEKIVGDYCNKYGLRDEKTLWEQLMDGIFEELGIIGDLLEKSLKGLKILARNVKNWYRFDGGREIVNAVIKGIGVVIAAIGLVIAIIGTGGAAGFALFAAWAGVVASAIALADSIVEFGYAIAAVSKASEGDPVWARRYETKSSNETLTSTLRRTGAYTLATIIDVVGTIAAVISFVKGAVDVGSTIKKFGKNSIKQGISNLKNNFKLLKNNADIRKFFLIGDTKKTLSTVKNGLKLTKQALSFVQDVSNEGWGEGLWGLGKFALRETVNFCGDLSKSNLQSDYLAQKYTDVHNDKKKRRAVLQEYKKTGILNETRKNMTSTARKELRHDEKFFKGGGEAHPRFSAADREGSIVSDLLKESDSLFREEIHDKILEKELKRRQSVEDIAYYPITENLGTLAPSLKLNTLAPSY